MKIRIFAIGLASSAVLIGLGTLVHQVHQPVSLEVLEQGRLMVEQTLASTTAPTPQEVEMRGTRSAVKSSVTKVSRTAQATRAHTRAQTETNQEELEEEQIATIRKFYDTGRYYDAYELAAEYLVEDPENQYVRRVAATSACAVDDVDQARKVSVGLNDADIAKISKRCLHRFGVDLVARL